MGANARPKASSHRTLDDMFLQNASQKRKEALCFAALGIPLAKIDEVEFRAAFKPSCTRKTLREEITTLAADMRGTLMERLTKQLTPTYCIALDGGTLHHCKHLNITIIFGKHSWFLKSCSYELRSSTAEEMSKDLLMVIEMLDFCSCTALITDNAPNVVAAAHVVQSKLPHILHVPCGCHTLQLAIKDLFGMIEELMDASVQSAALIKYCLRNDVSITLKKLVKAAESRPIAIIQPTETRWNSELNAMRRLVTLKAYIDVILAKDSDAPNVCWNTIQVSIACNNDDCRYHHGQAWSWNALPLISDCR